MADELKPIPKGGLEDYGITCDGRIWSYKTHQWLTNYTINRSGYTEIQIWNNEKRYNIHYSIHRLIALAWIPNPDNKTDVDHIDRDKSHNYVSNLRWVDHQTNCNNRKAGAKYAMYMATDHNTIIKVFECRKDAAEYLGVDGNKISDVANGYRPHIHGYWFQKL